MTETADFVKWIERLRVTRFGTWRALAQAIDMTESGLIRGVKKGTLNVANLVRLAEVAEEPPLTILRMAGKQQEAAILERAFGTGSATLKPSERKLLELWGKLESGDRAYVTGLMEHFAKTRGGQGDGLPAHPQSRDPQVRAAGGRRHR
jgi:hypothetical protein